MGYSKGLPGPPQATVTGMQGLGLSTAIAAVALLWQPSRAVLLQHGSEAVFWLLIVLSVFNPLSLVPEKLWGLALPCGVVCWLVTNAALMLLGDPMILVESGWRGMTSNFSLLQIAVCGSALLHITLTFLLNMWPIVVQNMPQLQRFKIQPDKAPATMGQWHHVFVHIFASQLFVQMPLITGQYFFIQYFSIPYSFETMPGFWDVAWRLALSLIVDDTWVYFGHTALHDRRIYKHIHKVHHTYQSPFAPDAEYEHPVETVVLGFGFFLACMLFTNHLAFMWAWLYMRLLVTYDSHSGYDLPFNLLHLIPGYSGAREHDWHHKFFNGNYAPTFLWWDRIFGSSAPYDKHERLRRMRNAASRGEELEQRGDDWYAAQKGVKLGKKAGVVDEQPVSVPFSTCLVTGSEGMVGRRLVAMLAARGAKRIVCLDIVDGPSAAFGALAERCKEEHGTELVYVRRDISCQKEMLGEQKNPFEGVEVVFHLAALVGPFHKHEAFAAVNEDGAKHVLEALVEHGVSTNPHVVLVDCSTPSTRYPLKGDISGLMEHELTYQTAIHEYATTKARGEKAIVEANGRKMAKGNNLATCAVAPHQVYAPEDQLFLPAMLQTAKSGKLRLFGDGQNITSFTHADNIAHGLVLAGAKLYTEGPKSAAAAEFFVVTDGGACSFWDAVNDAVVECGFANLYTKISYSPMLLSVVADLGVVYTKLTGKFVKLTPFTLRMLIIDRTFCTAKARHVLGYSPIISFEEGWAQTVAVARERLASEKKVA
mmetsp:Transcript_156838/g.503384  ORF Transcript_156838/g.503384 Transcript_156838/m.503384 type:complete len:765 (-) Transcript_156838:612-2906(-)